MVSLCVSRHLLLHFKSVTIALQGVDVDIVTEYSMIKTIKDTLKNVSHDMIWTLWINYWLGWKACDHLLMNAWFSLMKVNYLHVLSWGIINFDTNCLLILKYR